LDTSRAFCYSNGNLRSQVKLRKVMQEITKDTVDSYEYQQADNFNQLDLWMIKQKVNHLRGEILTIIDAVLGGSESLKPTKDLIHRAFTGHETVLYNMAYDGSVLEMKERIENATTSDEEKRIREQYEAKQPSSGEVQGSK